MNIFKDRFRLCLITPNETQYYNNSMTYRCLNSSKFISKHHFVDGIRDCPFKDDETFNQNCSLNDVRHRYNCSINGRNKCFASLIVDDAKADCEDRKNEHQLKSDTHVYSHDIHFQMICDGIDHLLPILIDGRNETDESGCSQSTCSEFKHSCVFPDDISKVSCLPISRAGNGVVDCLGATDERYRCQLVDSYAFEYGFQCWNESKCVDNSRMCITYLRTVDMVMMKLSAVLQSIYYVSVTHLHEPMLNIFYANLLSSDHILTYCISYYVTWQPIHDN